MSPGRFVRLTPILDFFELAGLSNALLGSVIVSCVGLMSAVVAFFLIELKSVGRWPLVFFGVLGITLSMCKLSCNPPTLVFWPWSLTAALFGSFSGHRHCR